jgi:hypothetical protein
MDQALARRKAIFALVGVVAGFVPGLLVVFLVTPWGADFGSSSLANDMAKVGGFIGIPGLFLLVALKIAEIVHPEIRRISLWMLIGLAVVSVLFFLVAPSI